MIGIVYATRREADPFLVLTAAKPLARQPVELFQTTADNRSAAIVAVSGMGKVAATLAAAHLVAAHHVSLLVNAGLGGCLNRSQNWPVGHLLRIRSAVEGDCDRLGEPEIPTPCNSRWFSHLEAARLVTCDRPVFQDSRRKELTALGDLADMEGAAVARVALSYAISCAMIKGISDGADEDGRRDIQTHIDRISRDIAEALATELMRHHADEHS